MVQIGEDTSERDVVYAECDTLLERNERLHHLLLMLERMQLGTKSERLPEEQPQLGLEAIEQAIAEERRRGGEVVTRI